MKIGEAIRQIRKERKMTQKDFAKILEISPSYLSELENGKRNLNISTINKIAEKLEVPPNYLITKAVIDQIDEMASGAKKMHDHMTEVFNKSYINAFNMLNDDGKAKLFKYAEELAKDDRYKAPKPLTIEIGENKIN